MVLNEKDLREDGCDRRERTGMPKRRQAITARGERDENRQRERSIICRQDARVALHREVAKIERCGALVAQR